MIKQQNTKRYISLLLTLALMVGSFSFPAVGTNLEYDYYVEPGYDYYENEDVEDVDECPDLEECEPLPDEDSDFGDENLEDELFPVSFESISAQSTTSGQLAAFGSIMYPSSWVTGNVIRGTTVFTLTIRGNTTLAYCLEPTIPPPPGGGYVFSLLAPGSPLSHALYYMWGAPGASQLFTTANRNHTINGLSVLPNIGTIPVTGMPNQGIEYLVSALMLAYIYADGNWSQANLSVLNNTGRAIVQWWVAQLRALPRPPDASKSFSNANLNAIIEDGRQITPWTIFQADHRNQITIPAPAGAEIQARAADGSWTGQWSNSVTVSGGQSVRLRSTTLTSVTGRWTSPPLQGSNNMQWRALILDRPAGQQDIGGWDYAYDPISPITLTVNWEQPTGNLMLRKISERGGTYGGGIQFRISGVDASNRHIVMTATTTQGDGGGWVVTSGLVAGRYRVEEINVPGCYRPPQAQYVTIAVGQQATVTFYNNLIRANIRGRKVDQDGNGLGGAVIGLFRPGETVFTTATALQTVTTPADGWFEFRNLTLLEHPALPGVFGWFGVRELVPPPDFLLNTHVHGVRLTYHGQWATLEQHLVNVPILPEFGHIAGRKVNSETGAGLNGALIGLFREGETNFNRVTALRVMFSGADGRFLFQNVPPGRYIVREIQAPFGFLLLPYSFVVQVVAGETVFLPRYMENEPFRASIVGVKRCARTGRPLAGAVIGLRDVDAWDEAMRHAEFLFYNHYQRLYPDRFEDFDAFLEYYRDYYGVDFNCTSWYSRRVTTGADGIWRFEFTHPQRVVIRELYAPVGFLLCDERIDFWILSSDQHRVFAIALLNEPILGSVRGLKLAIDEWAIPNR